MKIITICSAKGGVGKTTMTANLGAGLAQRGLPVVLIELDPKNALHWHLGGLDQIQMPGLSAVGVFQRTLKNTLYVSAYGVDFIPYGLIDEAGRHGFERVLSQDENWLKRNLCEAGFSDETVVLLDTPSGASVYLKQALYCTDFALLLLMADVASYATVSALESILQHYSKKNPRFLGSVFLLNQANSSQLSHDVQVILQSYHPGCVLPHAVRRQPEVEEALAFERPLLYYSPDSNAARDIRNVTHSIFTLAASIS